MEREELLRNLKQVREKEKDRKYSVGQLNVFDMVSDVINYLEHEEKPTMTNLQYVKRNRENIGLSNSELVCKLAFAAEHKKDCTHTDIGCKECRFVSMEKAIDYLSQGYKERVKLKQWEYDLIEHYGFLNRFDGGDTLMAMRSKGHLKGVIDTSMKIKDILEKYEIVPNDYNFEDCK